MGPRFTAGFCVCWFRTFLVQPTDDEVLEFIASHASVLTRDRKYPRWEPSEIMGELFILWAGIKDRYGETLDGRWRGLLKTAGARRLPDIYQKSLGNKIRRNPKTGMKRTYVSDADLMHAVKPIEYTPEDEPWSRAELEAARRVLDEAARSQAIQAALRQRGYNGPFPAA